MSRPRRPLWSTVVPCLLFPALAGCQRGAGLVLPDAGAAQVALIATSGESADAAGAFPAPVGPNGFEAELVGVLIEKPAVKAARYVVVNTREPCDPKTVETVPLSAMQHVDAANKGKKFYVEPWVRDGDQLHLCAFSLDQTGKKILSFGAYAKNPVTFRQPPPAAKKEDPHGHGEHHLELEGMDVVLTPLRPPVELTTSRF